MSHPPSHRQGQPTILLHSLPPTRGYKFRVMGTTKSRSPHEKDMGWRLLMLDARSDVLACSHVISRVTPPTCVHACIHHLERGKDGKGRSEGGGESDRAVDPIDYSTCQFLIITLIMTHSSPPHLQVNGKQLPRSPTARLPSGFPSSFPKSALRRDPLLLLASSATRPLHLAIFVFVFVSPLLPHSGDYEPNNNHTFAWLLLMLLLLPEDVNLCFFPSLNLSLPLLSTHLHLNFASLLVSFWVSLATTSFLLSACSTLCNTTKPPYIIKVSTLSVCNTKSL